jgi:hypothetical protein
LVQNAAGLSGTQWNSVDSTNQLQRYRANYPWDLSQLPNAQLHPGDVLEYYASAKDNYTLNGDSHPSVASGKLRIVIISQEEFNNKITDQLSDVAPHRNRNWMKRINPPPSASGVSRVRSPRKPNPWAKICLNC